MRVSVGFQDELITDTAWWMDSLREPLSDQSCLQKQDPGALGPSSVISRPAIAAADAALVPGISDSMDFSCGGEAAAHVTVPGIQQSGNTVCYDQSWPAGHALLTCPARHVQQPVKSI